MEVTADQYSLPATSRGPSVPPHVGWEMVYGQSHPGQEAISPPLKLLTWFHRSVGQRDIVEIQMNQNLQQGLVFEHGRPPVQDSVLCNIAGLCLLWVNG